MNITSSPQHSFQRRFRPNPATFFKSSEQVVPDQEIVDEAKLSGEQNDESPDRFRLDILTSGLWYAFDVAEEPKVTPVRLPKQLDGDLMAKIRAFQNARGS